MEKEDNRYCVYCDKPLAKWNKSGVCSNCQKASIWKEKYERLKEEMKKKEKLTDLVIKDLMKKLRKYEPAVTGLSN